MKKLNNWQDSHFINRFRFTISRKVSLFLLYRQFKGSYFIRNILTKLLTPKPKGPAICPTIYNDIEMLVDPVLDKGLERSIYFLGEYEAGTIFALNKLLKKGDIFLDVGANIGFISCLASKFVGEKSKVYVVEPHPEIFKTLEYNLKLNNIKNVSTHNIALGSKRQRALLFDNLEVSRGSASLIKSRGATKKNSNIVKVFTIDFLIKNKKIKPPKLIKIDVEGYELEVLKGARSILKGPNPPILCLEFTKNRPVSTNGSYKLYKYIKSFNKYTFYKLQYGKPKPSKMIKIKSKKELPEHDNIFCLPRNIKNFN